MSAAIGLAQRGAPDPVRAITASMSTRTTPTALALLERVVNINSGTLNFDGVREVGRIFRAELDGLGFTTRVGGWRGVAARGASRGRAPRAAGPPRMLLIGHLDTVFETDSPFQKFERIDERTGAGSRHHRHEGRRRRHRCRRSRRSPPPARWTR